MSLTLIFLLKMYSSRIFCNMLISVVTACILFFALRNNLASLLVQLVKVSLIPILLKTDATLSKLRWDIFSEVTAMRYPRSRSHRNYFCKSMFLFKYLSKLLLVQNLQAVFGR